MAFPLLLVIAAIGAGRSRPQEESLSEIRRIIEERFPGYSAERKDALAKELNALIPWDRWGASSKPKILHTLRFRTRHPLDSVVEGEQLCESLKKELEKTSALHLIQFPPEFRPRALEIAEAKLRAVVEEALSPGPPGLDLRKAMLNQLDRLEAVMIGEMRTIVAGPYAGDVIREVISADMERIRGAFFSPGGTNRPLSAEEFAALVNAIRERATGLPQMTANEPVRDDMSPSSRLIREGKRDTEAAMAAASELLFELPRWSAYAFPQYYRALALEDDFTLEIYNWKKKMLEEINKQLEAVDYPVMRARYEEVERQIEAASLKRRHFEPPPKKTPDPAKRQPSPARTGDPSAPPTPIRWVVGAAIILGVILTLSLLLRRARKQAA